MKPRYLVIISPDAMGEGLIAHTFVDFDEANAFYVDQCKGLRGCTCGQCWMIHPKLICLKDFHAHDLPYPIPAKQ
jgi:hypothetical protein